MDMTRRVLPLKAIAPGGDPSPIGAAGFLVMLDNQTYLMTVAHLATGQKSQSDDWSKWANELHYAPGGQTVLVLPLFNVGSFGERRPLFRFLRAADSPNILMDVIMLPLEPGEVASESIDIFNLPNDCAPTYSRGQEVLMAGCQPWPNVKVQSHSLIKPGVVHLVTPPQTRGFSGGPAVDANGLLVGMAFGTDEPNYSGHGQLVAAPLIARLANSVDGVG